MLLMHSHLSSEVDKVSLRAILPGIDLSLTNLPMANITVLKPDEAKIATLHMLGNSDDNIADQLMVAPTYVEATLKQKYVQDFIREVETQDAIAWGLVMKVKYAKGTLLPKIIAWCDTIVEKVSAEKWNKNHVDLFKFMLQDIKKEEPKIIQNILNQVNIQTVENTSTDMEELDEIITTLPSSVQWEFWQKVILLANQVKDDFSSRLIKPNGYIQKPSTDMVWLTVKHGWS